MSKPRHNSSGFSNTHNQHSSRTKPTKRSADYAAKELQAAALINKGKLQEAEMICKQLIAEDARNHISYCNLAAISGIQGKLDNCIELLGKALKIKPDFPEGHYNLGNALKDQGKLSAAINTYNTALKLKPNFPDAQLNLGIVLKEQGEINAAITCFNKALELKPNYPQVHYNLGNALKDQGKLTSAIAYYNKALELKPNYPEAHKNLGNTFREQGNIEAAIASYKKALKLDPKDAETHHLLGIALKEQGNTSVLISCFTTAIELKPNYPQAHYNLGVAFKEEGNLAAATTSFKTALQLKPNYPEAQKNLSMIELLLGDYNNGWEKYQSRLHCKGGENILCANPSGKQWGYDKLSQNSKLLLVSEQGLGDTLQFMRYAIALQKQGISISLCSPKKLHGLIQASGIDPSPLTPREANEFTEGQWTPLLSVPQSLDVSPENPIITAPYIKTTDELKSKWSGILAAEQRPIIGINWQGNPKIEKTDLRGRSLPLEAFAPITKPNHASLLSLQKGFGSEQLETCSFKDRFVSAQTQINDTWDFLETAAIITNCDLVITTDTSMAHLAGGMGKTTWLLLHHIPDWRWGLEGDITFWYPSMRLFRQKERGNWNEVMKRVAESLQEHFENISAISEPTANNQPLIKPAQIKEIHAPISLGELVDKITILQIKTKHLQDSALENTEKELEALERTLDELHLDMKTTLIQQLKKVNQTLWKIEDDIRDKERQKNFGEEFIHLARSVYQQNDIRAAIKKEINTAYGSALVEEKSYQQY